ncbi:hypothetical protein [Chryseobacterium binzhouense]|uniref:hypothetical protein n=1 Tax=Chryseobacterium binzhouense TaxID=2593646 RepID=UPI00289CC791|nr:hypothetical protein [Chryseobacterium binzhouense]
MKKLVSILLLSLFLVSTTELYQLFKIPALVEHYWEHKHLNPEMPLIAFFKAHYDHPAKDGDYGKDRKLPFIIHAKPLNLVFTLQQGFRLELQNNSFKISVSHKIPSKDEDFCYKGFTGSVWEPPKNLA